MMIGSDDMRYPQKRDSDEFSDAPHGTVFDERSMILNRVFSEINPRVNGVEMMEQGFLVVKFGPSIVLQIFPDCSGRVEMWRFFLASGKHYGFPCDLF
jgi:hypothetical protein